MGNVNEKKINFFYLIYMKANKLFYVSGFPKPALGGLETLINELVVAMISELKYKRSIRNTISITGFTSNLAEGWNMKAMYL